MNKIEKIAEECYRTIVAPLISHPEDLEVNFEIVNNCVEINVRANYADNGQLRGRNGATYIAINEILTLMAERHSANFDLNPHLLQSAVGGSPEFEAFVGAKNWNSSCVKKQINAILNKICRHDFSIREIAHDKDFSTKFTIVFSKKEQLSISAGQIGYALSRIFNSGWKKHGRKIYISGSEATT